MATEYVFMSQKVIAQELSWLLLGDLYMPILKSVVI